MKGKILNRKKLNNYSIELSFRLKNFRDKFS